MNSNIQHNQTKQKLSEKLKNLFNLSLLAASRVSPEHTTALGKNHQALPDLIDDFAIQQSTIINTSLRGLLPRILSIVFVLFLFSSHLFASTVNLAWDASNSSGVGGYKVSYGISSGNYATTIDANNQTTYAVSGLQENTKYYFAVKAYDSARTTESVYSNEVNLTVPVTSVLAADFTASQTSGDAGLVVNFTPVTTGTITNWTWDFTGSNTPSVTNSTGQIVTATYPTAGTYSVSLTVTGSSGSVTKTYPNLITVTSATTPDPTPTPTPSNGLVAAYGFEETSGMSVSDASNNGNNGIITNAARITNGHSGNALSFNGANAWVTVNDSSSLDLSTGLTLEAWVYPQSLTSGGKTVILKEQSGGAVYNLYSTEDANVPISSFNDGSYRVISGPNQLPVNQWTHLVATYDGLYQRLYVNGTQVAQSAQNGLIQQSTGVLRIGGNSVWGEYFKGYIDEVRIYNRALTTAEINSNLATAISVSNPPQNTTLLAADFTASKTSGDASLVVDFTPVTTGAVTSWTWDFAGSNTPSVTNSTAQVVTVTYPTPGTYSVSLTATGSSGSVTKTYPDLITVTAAPLPLTADFTASQTSGVEGLVVNFTPVTTGTVTNWSWDFTGSYTPSITTTTAQVATVTYPTPGTYSVSLTVTGPSGSVTKTKSNLITVTTPPPVANFTATPTSGIAPVSVNFTDTSSGSITSRSWNFGDGTTSTAAYPTHTYSATGTYTVSLTVTGAGGSATKTNNGFISVSAPPAPPPPPDPETSNSGLVAAYGFEEISGTIVADASGNGNHGTIKEAVRITTGHSGKALKFDGVNDWVTVNDSASLDLSTGMTLEAWVHPMSQTNGGNTVILKEASGAEVYALYSEEDINLPVSYFNDGSYQAVTGPNRLPVNTWTHLVATYDGQYQRLYVNGVEVAKSAQNTLIKQSDGVLRIGGNSLWGEYFDGKIDEVRIYNRALTATEVGNNLATPVSGASTPSATLQFILGNKNLEPWVDYNAQGVAQAFQAVPEKSGSVSEVKVYLDAGSTTATKLIAGIYTDNNAHPGTLVAQGTLDTLKPGAWNSVTISAASVTAGKPYWLAILGPDGQVGFLDQVGSGTSVMERTSHSHRSTLTSLPDTWNGSSRGYQTNASMSVYGNGN